jgi:signal transduction histidine kinase
MFCNLRGCFKTPWLRFHLTRDSKSGPTVRSKPGRAFSRLRGLGAVRPECSIWGGAQSEPEGFKIHEALTDKTRCQMDLLRGRVHRMEGLIDGLLQYSRIGRMATTPETVVVNELLNEIIDFLSPSPGFAIEVAPNLPTLYTDRLGLPQVFANLISNAIKHHDRPHGRVWITGVDRGKCYEFTVKDDGPGISAQFHEKVFIIFQTLESRDKSENTGIGLSLVKKIVEGQGGTIHLESKPGQGVTFRFTWMHG